MNQDELHAAVCADPDAEAPRVAYADFLKPYSPERSEFVRLQLARFAADRAASKLQCIQSPAEVGLVHEHGIEWARYMRMFLVPGETMPLGCRFERGFIAHARVAIENVMGLGDRLAQYAPIQHLDVTPGHAEGAPGRIVNAKILGRLDSISLVGLGLTNDDAPALASCESLRRARWIDLSHNHLGIEGIRVLAKSSVFANKVRVLFAGNISDPVVTPSFDFDGSVVYRGASIDPRNIEDAVGHEVPWLHYPWHHRNDEPDRYYARYV